MQVQDLNLGRQWAISPRLRESVSPRVREAGLFGPKSVFFLHVSSGLATDSFLWGVWEGVVISKLFFFFNIFLELTL